VLDNFSPHLSTKTDARVRGGTCTTVDPFGDTGSELRLAL